MNILLWVIIVTGIAGIGGTGLGGIIGILLGRNSDKIISLLLSFAAGVMISVVCFDLLTDALKITGIPYVFGGVILGFSTVFLLNDIIDRIFILKTPVIEKDSTVSSNSGLLVGGTVMAAAIAIHNLPEGMVIGASLARANPDLVYNFSELGVALIIGLHDIPEGTAVAVPLISGGLKKPYAAFLTALTGLPTVIGALIGYKLGTINPIWLSLSLSFASGAMLYVIFGELIPDSVIMWRSKFSVSFLIFGILLGLIIIYV